MQMEDLPCFLITVVKQTVTKREAKQATSDAWGNKTPETWAVISAVNYHLGKTFSCWLCPGLSPAQHAAPEMDFVPVYRVFGIKKRKPRLVCSFGWRGKCRFFLLCFNLFLIEIQWMQDLLLCITVKEVFVDNDCTCEQLQTAHLWGMEGAPCM